VPEDRARPLARSRRAEATALPSWIKPQLTKLVDQPPDGSEWLHEIKFDGYRMHRSNMAEGTSQGLTLAIDAPLADHLDPDMPEIRRVVENLPSMGTLLRI
jgi:hypothetical protein